MDNSKFIITTSKDTVDTLAKLGFKMLNSTGNHWVFLNNNKINFSHADLKGVVFTNRLHI